MVSFDEKKKYIRWYRLAQRAIEDEKIAPKLSEKQIVDSVSRENWLPIASPDLIKGRKEVKNSVYPNIYIQLSEDEPKMRMGIVFNTVGSINRIRKSILTPYSKREKRKLVRCLRALGDGYKTEVLRKIRPDYRRPPDYVDSDEDPSLFAAQTNKIDDESVERMFSCVNRVRDEGMAERRREVESGRKSYTNTPVIDLAVVTMSLDEGEYIKMVKELVKTYRICLDIKTVVEIRRRKRRETREADGLRKRKRILKPLSSIPQYSRHREAAKELRRINKRLRELEKRTGDTGVGR